MNKIQILFLMLASVMLLATSGAYAGDAIPPVARKGKDEKNMPHLKDSSEYQKIIDDYKAYVNTIPAEIREEVIAFRKEVAKLNKEKRTLYRKLSQASQDYLKKEQQYKKKLPLQRKNLIKLDNLSDSPATAAENKQDSQSQPADE